MKLLSCLAAGLFFCSCSVRAKSVALKAGDCRSAPTALISRSSDWARIYSPYVEICPVRNAMGKTVLSVLVFRLDKADANGFFEGKPDQLPIPRPIILDNDGHKIGQIRDSFPETLPGRTQIFFSNWHDGFPHYVRTHLIDAPPCDFPYDQPSLNWNEKQHRYMEDRAVYEGDC